MCDTIAHLDAFALMTELGMACNGLSIDQILESAWGEIYRFFRMIFGFIRIIIVFRVIVCITSLFIAANVIVSFARFPWLTYFTGLA